MFGHQDTKRDDQSDPQSNASVDDAPVNPVAVDELSNNHTPTYSDPLSDGVYADSDHSGGDTNNDDSTSEPSNSDATSPDLPMVTDQPNDDDSHADSHTDSTPAVDEDLLDIKRQALQQLTPLVGQLDQTPEEKFRTTMMMIQAADNQSLIETAYKAAQAITDEKTKAQALLDIVNEINYFTHKHGS
jgi:hypothetical protein